MLLKTVKFLCLFTLLASCSGYHFKQSSNPLERFNVSSVAIPMFINQSVYPRGGVVFTKEMRRLFSQFYDLKVYSGEKDDADAVLVGILTSDTRLDDAVKALNPKLVDGELKDSIGDRKQFNVMTENQYRLTLKLYLIKRPTKRERELLRSKYSNFIKQDPRIVLSERFDLSGRFSRTVTTSEITDSGGVVNFTKNKKTFERSLEGVAKSVANQFRGVVLNAF